MAGFGSPMEHFQMGQAGGQANSTAFAMGNAITKIVDHARAKGLLGEQSAQQGAQGMALAKYKSDLGAPVGFPDGVTPQAEADQGLIKVPEYDTQGRPTGGFKWINPKAGNQISIFGDDPGGNGNQNPADPNLKAVADEEIDSIIQTILDQRKTQ